MSERGSFVTEVLHCDECISRLKGVFEDSGGYIRAAYFEEHHIFAGRSDSSHPWGEVLNFISYAFSSKNAPCHNVRIAIITDVKGGAFLTVYSNGSVMRDVVFNYIIQ